MNYKVKSALLGFPNIHEVELEEHDGLSTLLKADDNIKMVLINAKKDDSLLEIPSNIRVLLDLHRGSNYSVYFIVTMSKDISKSIINLGSPLIFNEDNKTMAQASINIQKIKLEDFDTIEEREAN